jgi:type I restriction enzyme S subunit
MREVNLIDVCVIKNGYAFKSSEFKDSGTPLIRISSFNNGPVYFDDRTVYVENEYLESKSTFKVEKGDVLIALSGATTGKYGLYTHDEPSLLNQRVGLLKSGVSQDLDDKYFYFYLSVLQAEIFRKAGGAAQPNISTKEISELKIPLPPLEQQKKIAAILDAADTYRQKTKALITKYDVLTQSLFLDMFGDPVRNPKGWDKIKLEEIGTLSSGSTPSRKVEENFIGDIPWVKTGEVNSKIIFDTEEKISEAALKNSSCKLYPAGSLIIAMYGQGKTRGQVGLLGIDASTNQACAVLTKSDKVNFTFLYKLIQMSYEDLRSLGRGGNQPNLNSGILKKYLVLNPPRILQNQFAERVKAIEIQKTQAEASLVQADNLFNSLLQRAFKGELV